MFIRLCLLFVLVPCIELFLLFEIGGRIGFGETVGVILLTGVGGAWLAKWQGYQAVERLRSALAQGRVPADEALDGFLVFAGGLLLITPGFLTDAVGFSLLIPSARSVLKHWIRRSVKARFRVVSRAGGTPDNDTSSDGEDDVIDVSATSRSTPVLDDE